MDGRVRSVERVDFELIAVMRAWLFLLALLFIGMARAAAAEDPGMTFYLQLVRGNDEDRPPARGAKPIGPELSQRLHAVFRWKHYWELKRDQVVLKSGAKVRRQMTAEREVEIQRLNQEQVEIRVYREGKVARIERHSTRTQFILIGGDKEENQCWFIVVRRDKPPDQP